MATYALNSIGVCANQSSWELVTNTKVYTSPFTGAIQTTGRQGSRWQIELTWKNLCDDDRADLQAFFTRLNGQEHRFTYEDEAYERRGLGGSGVVNGAGQTGNIINIIPPALAGNWLEPGDQFSVNGQLKMVSVAVPGSGVSEAVEFQPPIHISPANADTVLAGNTSGATRPFGTFILTSVFGWNNRPGVFSDFSISAIEDVLVT